MFTVYYTPTSYPTKLPIVLFFPAILFRNFITQLPFSKPKQGPYSGTHTTVEKGRRHLNHFLWILCYKKGNSFISSFKIKLVKKNGSVYCDAQLP